MTRPYNPKATCPKCGGKGNTTSFHETDSRCRRAWIREVFLGAHMHRSCSLCGYEWDELPLAAKPEEEGEK